MDYSIKYTTWNRIIDAHTYTYDKICKTCTTAINNRILGCIGYHTTGEIKTSKQRQVSWRNFKKKRQKVSMLYKSKRQSFIHL